MPLLSLEQLVYVQILKISSSLVSHYPTVQDRLLWLIAIPHFIVALFLVFAMGWIAGGHKGLGRLGGILIYLFLILGGWYGKWMVPLINQYFVITVALMFVFFLISRIISPLFVPGAAKLGGAIAGKVGEATIGKVRGRKEAEKQLEETERAIRELEHRFPHGNMPDQASGIYAQLLVKREQLRKMLED